MKTAYTILIGVLILLSSCKETNSNKTSDSAVVNEVTTESNTTSPESLESIQNTFVQTQEMLKKRIADLHQNIENAEGSEKTEFQRTKMQLERIHNKVEMKMKNMEVDAKTDYNKFVTEYNRFLEEVNNRIAEVN